jgi:hypothetical protein
MPTRRIPIKVTMKMTTRVRTQFTYRQQLSSRSVVSLGGPVRPAEINNYGDTNNHYGDVNTITGDFTQVAIRTTGSVTQISGQTNSVDLEQVRMIIREITGLLPSFPLDADEKEAIVNLARTSLEELDSQDPDVGRLRRLASSIKSRLDTVATQAAGGLVANQLGAALAAAFGG